VCTARVSKKKGYQEDRRGGGCIPRNSGEKTPKNTKGEKDVSHYSNGVGKKGVILLEGNSRSRSIRQNGKRNPNGGRVYRMLSFPGGREKAQGKEGWIAGHKERGKSGTGGEEPRAEEEGFYSYQGKHRSEKKKGTNP